MRLIPTCLFALLLPTLSGCEPMSKTPEPESRSMDGYAWSSRPVIVFADQRDSVLLAEQRRLLDADPAGLAERHIVVVQAIDDAVIVDNKPVKTRPADLRRRYGVAPDAPFAVLLIGKDTGVKLRRDEPVALDRLFGLIDAMPMRQREMRDQNSK